MSSTISVLKSGIRIGEAEMMNAANNGASSNNVGFWAQTLLSTDMKHGKLTASNNALDKGMSVGSDTYSPFVQGELKETHNSLCYSVTDDKGFLKLVNEKGDVCFSRTENFDTIRDEKTNEITGEKTDVYYLGRDGFLAVGSDDEKVEWDPNDKTKKLDLGVFDVKEYYKMRPIGDSRFVYEGLGEPWLIEGAETEQGSLEYAIVDMAGEAVKLGGAYNKLTTLFGAFVKKIKAGDDIVGLLGGDR
ncbi:hypothetical protein FACS1894198_1870 [Clostridia bacterium]|nr:hypothetical protein FACS1894198_1870 [Clostridia bacterium]